jgi:hypothetical protein
MAVRNIDGGYTLTKDEARLVHEFISKASWWGDTKLEKLKDSLPGYIEGQFDLKLSNERFNVTDRKPDLPMPAWERELLEPVKPAALKVGDSIWRTDDFKRLPVGTHLTVDGFYDEVVLTEGALVLNLTNGNVYSMNSLCVARKIVSFGALEKVDDYSKEPVGTIVFYDDSTLNKETHTWEKVAADEWHSTTGMVKTNTYMGWRERVLRFRPPAPAKPQVRVLKAGDAVLTQEEADSLPIGASIWYDGNKGGTEWWVRESATRWVDGNTDKKYLSGIDHNSVVRPAHLPPRIVRSLTPDVVAPDPKNPKVKDYFDTTEQYELLPVGTELTGLWIKHHDNLWHGGSSRLSSQQLANGRYVSRVGVKVPEPVFEYKVGDQISDVKLYAHLPNGTKVKCNICGSDPLVKDAYGWRHTGGINLNDKDMAKYAGPILSLPAQFRVGGVVRTAEELDALPVGTELWYNKDHSWDSGYFTKVSNDVYRGKMGWTDDRAYVLRSDDAPRNGRMIKSLPSGK